MAGRGRGAALTVPAWMKEQAAAASRAANAAAPTTAPLTRPSLQPEWARAVAPNGRPYWYNRITNQTTWDEPTSGSAATVSLSANAPTAQAETANAPTAHALTAHTANAPAAETNVQTWAKHTTGDGRTYYYDKFTRETRWEKPEGFDEDPSPDQNATTAVKSGKISTVQQQRAVAAGDNVASVVTNGEKYVRRTDAAAAALGTRPDQKNTITAPPSHAAMEPLASGWVAYAAPDGRQYYHNATLDETTWERPTASRIGQTPAASPAAVTPSLPLLPGSARHLSASVTRASSTHVHDPPLGALNRSVEPSAEPLPLDHGQAGAVSAETPKREAPRQTSPIRPTKRRRRTRAPPTGYVARPRDKDGKYMTDKKAEAYFLARAAKERGRLLEVDRKSRMAAGKGDRGEVGKRMAEKLNAEKRFREKSGVLVRNVQIETSWNDRKRFEQVMRESDVAKSSSWLETMARCTPDERYIADLTRYGHRKLAYNNFIAKEARAAREAAALAIFKAEGDFIALVRECFSSEPDSVTTFSACSPETVKRLESDPRYAAFPSAAARSNAIRSFCRDRERVVLEKELSRKRELKLSMRQRMDSLTDPSLRLKQASARNNVRSSTDDMPQNPDKPEVIPERVNGTTDLCKSSQSEQAADSGPLRWLNERTSLREIENRLMGSPEIEHLSPKERAEVYGAWLRDTERAFAERQAREIDAAKREAEAAEKAFIVGIEKLMLEGRVSFRALWRDVASKVLEEDFGKAASILAASKSIPPLPKLFEKGMDLFYTHVDLKNDEFRSAFKAAPADVMLKTETSVEDIRKLEVFQHVLDGVPDSVAGALLYERRKKEIRRKEQAISHFEELLERRNIDATTKWEILKSSLLERTAYKNLFQLVGADGVKAVFDGVVDLHEKRRKRRSDEDAEGSRSIRADAAFPARESNLKGIGSHDGRALPIAGMQPPLKKSKYGPAGPRGPPPVFSKKEEDSGWAAVISQKPLSDKERREELERKKREILARAPADTDKGK